MRVAYLGPSGTFSEAALRRFDPTAEAVPVLDVPTALDLVRAGSVDRAVVPIENSTEGGVSATIDSLGRGAPLSIVGEVVIPVTFALVARAGTRIEDVRRVGTHPHAWAQCRRWLHDHVPLAVHVPVGSTADGPAQLAAGEADFDAGLCSPLSASLYDVEVLAEGAGDIASAVTRFVVVAGHGQVPPRTGADKTTLMVQLPQNEAGSLLTMLEQFAVRGVNLSRIESRPLGDALGRYAFSIDAEGHVAEERMQAVLIGLHRVCPAVLFLGSYPSAEGKRAIVRSGTADADFRRARAWVDSIQGEPAPEGAAEQRTGTRPPGDAKARILAAAHADFVDHGYSGASLRRIAAAAGVDAGLIGYHFGSKAKLFGASIDLKFADLTAASRQSRGREAMLDSVAQSVLDWEHQARLDQSLIQVRTILSPSREEDPVRSAMVAQWCTALEEASAESDDPLAFQVLLALSNGVFVSRYLLGVRRLAEMSLDDLAAATRARAALALDVLAGDWDRMEIPPDAALPAIDWVTGTPSRDAILRAAKDLFARWGYQRASLRDIATAAECDISLIHYYFGSKLGLFEAAIRGLDAAASAVADACIEDGPGAGAIAAAAPTGIFSDERAGGDLRALLVSASDPGGDDVLGVIQTQANALFEVPTTTGVAGPEFHLHIAHHLGLLTLREFVRPRPIADLSDSQVNAYFGHVLQRIVDAVNTRRTPAAQNAR